MNSKEPFMQLPHFDSVTVGKIKNKLNNMSILNYCKLDKEKRLETVKHVFEGKGDINYIADQQEKCIDNLPVVEMKIEAKVEGEEEIVVGDIMSINLTVKYLKNQEGEKHGYVHSTPAAPVPRLPPPTCRAAQCIHDVLTPARIPTKHICRNNAPACASA